MVISTESDCVVHISDKQEDMDRVLDLYCGGGGSGSGILDAYEGMGRRCQGTFVNHWDKAIQIHDANHPEHLHLEEDLFLMDPVRTIPKNRRTSLLWGSPSCVQHSTARGNRPISEQQRSHADVIPKWVEHTRPLTILVENVRQFLDWTILIQARDKDGKLAWAKGNTRMTKLPEEHLPAIGESEAEWEFRMITLAYERFLVPDKTRKGELFRAWRKTIEELGYVSDYRFLRSADFGDPTIRQRLFVQFQRAHTGRHIYWPKPTHAKPDKQGQIPTGLKPWRTAREIIDWNLKGESIFLRKRPLAKNTMRRLAIGLVKFGLKDFLVPADNFGGDRVRSADDPVSTLKTEHRGEGVAMPTLESFRLPSNKGFTDNANVASLDKPLETMTPHGRAESLAEPFAFIVPKDQGHQKDHVQSADYPLPTVQTTSHDRVAQPCLIKLNGQSTAISPDEPIGALTGMQKEYVMEPVIAHLRGDNTCSDTNTPLRSLTANGTHELLAEAFLMAIDQAGKDGSNSNVYSADEPVHTVVTKANQAGARFSLQTLQACVVAAAPEGVDTRRVLDILEPLLVELKKAGRADVRGWIYTYYSSGSPGMDIEEPLPTVRTHEGAAVCYPVLEFDGQFLLLDVLYRMLTTRELQLAQGFDADYKWAGCTKTDIVKAIGNSVSCGLAKALTTAAVGQTGEKVEI
jgi:DNA (cytosine-5)-methyltransferase 1